MGLYIFTTVNFNKKVTARAWENAWQESLHLLRQFPAPLVRIKWEEVEGHQRIVFTRQVVDKPGTPDEQWHVVGDALSKKRAESFILHRHRAACLPDRAAYSKDRDVLWADEDSLSYIDCNGYGVFNSKTQGYPFHLAILAVGMLLESRFPGSACVNGDIELRQAEWMQTWANSHLDEPLELPVCFDPDRLWHRLHAAYSGNDELALKRFGTLFKGSEEERMEALFRLVGRDTVMKEWSEMVAGYEDLNTWGVSNLVRQLVNVTGDVKGAVEAVWKVKKQKRKEKFTLEDLLALLCRSLLTIDFPEREALRSLYRQEGQLQTIEGVFGQLFAKMSGMPDEVNTYMPADQLLDLFAGFEPEKKAAFGRIIEEKTKQYREQLAKIEQTLNDIEEAVVANSSAKQQGEQSDKSEGTPTPSVPPALPVRSFSEAEKYILRQVRAQQTLFEGEEETVRNLAQQLHQAIREASGNSCSVFSINDLQELRFAIWDASHQSGFALHEEAWAAIDALRDKMVLKCLLGLASVENNEMNFWRWRLHIMESPRLWSFFSQTPQIAEGGQ